MSYRPWLAEQALRQMNGLPGDAFDMLVSVLARVCEDPYDPVFSVPVGSEPRRRVAELSDFGFVVFVIDEAARLLRIYDLVWVGLHARQRRLRHNSNLTVVPGVIKGRIVGGVLPQPT